MCRVQWFSTFSKLDTLLSIRYIFKSSIQITQTLKINIVSKFTKTLLILLRTILKMKILRKLFYYHFVFSDFRDITWNEIFRVSFGGGDLLFGIPGPSQVCAPFTTEIKPERRGGIWPPPAEWLGGPGAVKPS